MSRSRIVFFGNERLATAVETKAPTLRALVRAGYEIPAVITSFTQGISRQPKRLEIVEVAHAYHIPVIMPDKLSEIADKLKDFDAQSAVLVAYGKIIPEVVIDLFPKGIINIHPSLLPQYRGSTPIETAILEGTPKTGVSIMQLTPEMDTGPVYAYAELELDGDETKQQLADELLNLGGKLLLDNLPAILSGTLQPTPQDDNQVTYTKLIKKADGVIDWQKPAEQIERETRAYGGWPKSIAKINGHDVIVAKARVAKNENDGHLVMRCNPGYLEIQELIAPSGRNMLGSEFLRGYSKQS